MEWINTTVTDGKVPYRESEDLPVDNSGAFGEKATAEMRIFSFPRLHPLACYHDAAIHYTHIVGVLL